MAFIRR